jgi:hypothetical protein
MEGQGRADPIPSAVETDQCSSALTGAHRRPSLGVAEDWEVAERGALALARASYWFYPGHLFAFLTQCNPAPSLSLLAALDHPGRCRRRGCRCAGRRAGLQEVRQARRMRQVQVWV